MLSLGAFGFAAPWALAALALLPALWWLLRVTPPAPARIVFPPFRLLAALISREQTAVRTPWWLLALRLALAAALILGIAGPVLTGGQALPGSGPVILVVDDGWAAADDWDERQAAVNQLIDRAERERRSVLLVPTAPDGADEVGFPPGAMTAGAAREAAQAIRPKPWATDRAAATATLADRANREAWPPGAVVWIADGLDQPKGTMPIADWLDRLGGLGRVTVKTGPEQRLPLLIRPAEAGAAGPEVALLRAGAAGDLTVALRLLDGEGTVLARQQARLADGEARIRVPVNLPAELASRLASVRIEGSTSAASVLLADERWQRRAVGVVGEPSGGQPLLGATYYLERALQPFAEVRHGDVLQLLSRPLAMLILADVGSLDAASADALRGWVEEGGVLLRFAGPRLAREASAEDPLLPVALRAGDRVIGGALSWSGSGRIAAFQAASPFHGLPVSGELTVQRQVIAEPSLTVPERTWAQLEDGTPLITGVRRGNGWVVLVHTTASPDWSNLPLSGLFVELLRRIVGLAAGGQPQAQAPLLPPLETLDGFGRLGAPPPGTRPIPGGAFAVTLAGPRHPPGFYGTAEAKRALNLGSSVADPAALPALPANVGRTGLGAGAERDLRPGLLAFALVLALADLAISLWLRRSPGGFSRRAGGAGGMAVLALLLCASPSAASAQTVVADGSAAAASLSTRLAYVRTGNAGIDEVSEAALAGLSAVVNRRTAAELGPPEGLDPERAELAFYPLLYWPLADTPKRPSPEAARRLTAYMRSGGTIVFDTRGRTDGDDRLALRELARALDLPPLIPVPEDHVLRRSYYLLSDMPGRRAGQTVWIEQPAEHVNDGVSAVIAGSSDWAGAWAVDGALRPMFAVVPGGERQREQAYRFGVNLVMYVLTGNYKADQVHLPTIMERLGP